MAEQGTLQFQDSGANPTSPLRFNITPIPHKIAKTFIEQFHYSHRIPTGKNICFGLWYGDTLYAAIIYGIGINPYQAKFLRAESVMEIKRLCRSEPRRPYELSRFIRLTLRMLRKSHMVDVVVAFADPEQGHYGTVYKATGFKHEGHTNAEWHLVGENGEKRHRRYAFRMSRRKGISIEEARKALGMKRVKTKPKYRWVLRLV